MTSKSRSVRGGRALWSCLTAMFVVSVLVAAPERDAQTLASIPLEMTGLGAVVQARVNGEGPFRLIVDSSAEITFLSHRVVGALGDDVVVIRNAENVYDRGSWRKATTRVSTIALGDLVLRDIPAVVVDLTTVFGDKETPDGLLGFDLFASYLLTIDIPGERLQIDRGALPPPDGKSVLDYIVEGIEKAPGKYPAIRLRLDDRILRARLDTASSGEIMLPTEFTEKLPLTGEPGRMAMARTPDGDFDILGATLAGKARIGSHNLERPKLRFSELYDDASLGTDLLNQFALTFDQANRRVRFEQPADYRDPLHEKASHIKPVSVVGDDLRTAFNKHSETVQLVMILSPT